MPFIKPGASSDTTGISNAQLAWSSNSEVLKHLAFHILGLFMLILKQTGHVLGDKTLAPLCSLRTQRQPSKLSISISSCHQVDTHHIEVGRGYKG